MKLVLDLDANQLAALVHAKNRINALRPPKEKVNEFYVLNKILELGYPHFDKYLQSLPKPKKHLSLIK